MSDRWLVSRRERRGGYAPSVEDRPPDGCETLPIDYGDAERYATAIVTRAVTDVEDIEWRLELARYAFSDLREPLLAAQTLADALGERPASPALCLPLSRHCDRDTALRCAQAELAALNRSNPPPAGIPKTVFLSFVLSSITLLLALVQRYGGSSPGDLSAGEEARPLVAVHGENATRTRHIVAALSADRRVSTRRTILLLGRPRSTIVRSVETLDPDGSGGPLLALRPLDRHAALSLFGKIASIATCGLQALREARFGMPRKALIAIVYRFVQGAAHANWWGRVPGASRPASVVFGHTGTADTSALERAMQRGGVRTVHAAHGTNTGWPFSGISDRVIHQSAGDARLARTLPAYGESVILPAPQPKLAESGDRWAVLTSYTHPFSQSFEEHGADPDISLVSMIERAARAHGQPPERIVWRPHPAIDTIAAAERERLLARVAEAGFQRWPSDLPYAKLASFAVVITTPSTVLSDALRMGQPAIVAATAALQRDAIYAGYPILVRTDDELSAAIGRVTDPDTRAAQFAAAWREIMPGAVLDIGQATKF